MMVSRPLFPRATVASFPACKGCLRMHGADWPLARADTDGQGSEITSERAPRDDLIRPHLGLEMDGGPSDGGMGGQLVAFPCPSRATTTLQTHMQAAAFLVQIALRWWCRVCDFAAHGARGGVALPGNDVVAAAIAGPNAASSRRSDSHGDARRASRRARATRFPNHPRRARFWRAGEPGPFSADAAQLRVGPWSDRHCRDQRPAPIALASPSPRAKSALGPWMGLSIEHGDGAAPVPGVNASSVESMWGLLPWRRDRTGWRDM